MNKILYERIRERRKALGLSQAQLASLVGYKGKSMISRIEAGHVDLSESKIMLFAKALKTNPEFLMGWTSDPEPESEYAKSVAITKKWEKAIPTSVDFLALYNKYPILQEALDLHEAYKNAPEATKKAIRIMLGLDE